MSEGSKPYTPQAASAEHAAAAAAAAAAAPALPAQRRKRALFIASCLAGALALAAFGLYWWSHGRFLIETDDAYVRADWVAISPRIAGYVAEVLVEDNQPVKAGDLLLRIEARDFRERLHGAKAQRRQAEAALAGQQASLVTLDARVARQAERIRAAQASLLSAEAEARRARLDFSRYRDLVAQKASSPQRLETASASQAKARAALAEARAMLSQEQAQTDVLLAARRQAEAEVIRRQARLSETESDLGLARNALADTEIRAPFDGVVGQRRVRRQQYAVPGLPLLALVPVEQSYVVANFKETQLERMQPGQPVEIAIDSFSGQRWHGRVESLSPGSGALFALLPPDNATGNFTKIVQRFPVKIRLDADTLAGARILPGMSVIATVDTRKETPTGNNRHGH